MHDDSDARGVNPSLNPTLGSILDARLSRRAVIRGGLGAAALTLLGDHSRQGFAHAAEPTSRLGFTSLPVSTADTVVVPPGYTVEVLYAWGDPISDGPAFRPDAGNSAAEQARQAGMHHDGLHFFPLPLGARGSDHGLLAVNHEYTDDGLLHVGGMEPWTAAKVEKSQAAHGVSVVELRRSEGRWTVVRPSSFAQRVTARTPILVDGPAAGYRLLQTADDPTGRLVLGTINNCALGVTPWGTYLTCEENFNGYFVNGADSIPFEQRRYGITRVGRGYRWHEHDARFDAARHPHEPNRFGWVVELDPCRNGDDYPMTSLSDGLGPQKDPNSGRTRVESGPAGTHRPRVRAFAKLPEARARSSPLAGQLGQAPLQCTSQHTYLAVVPRGGN